jgi:hypothetical protein
VGHELLIAMPIILGVRSGRVAAARRGMSVVLE